MKKILWHKTARGAKRGGEHCPPVDILFSDQAKQNVERLKQNDELLSREMRINQMIWSEYYGASKRNNLKIKRKHFHIICIIYNYYLKTYFPYWHIFILRVQYDQIPTWAISSFNTPSVKPRCSSALISRPSLYHTAVVSFFTLPTL